MSHRIKIPPPGWTAGACKPTQCNRRRQSITTTLRLCSKLAVNFIARKVTMQGERVNPHFSPLFWRVGPYRVQLIEKGPSIILMATFIRNLLDYGIVTVAVVLFDGERGFLLTESHPHHSTLTSNNFQLGQFTNKSPRAMSEICKRSSVFMTKKSLARVKYSHRSWPGGRLAQSL
jgi:hypothetical protein